MIGHLSLLLTALRTRSDDLSAVAAFVADSRRTVPEVAARMRVAIENLTGKCLTGGRKCVKSDGGGDAEPGNFSKRTESE